MNKKEFIQVRSVLRFAAMGVKPAPEKAAAAITQIDDPLGLVDVLRILVKLAAGGMPSQEKINKAEEKLNSWWATA